AVNVLVIEQVAAVLLLVAGVSALVGSQISKIIRFPLLFLFMAVPMGEGLIPILMNYTAFFAVKAIQLTGIPVYKEGLYLYLPTGTWHVIEACSGIRFLIASFTLGLLIAYLNFRTFWKRIVVILVALLVPVLANGVRAYTIIMLGHTSNMQFGAGDEHITIGWIFYALVMVCLILVGNLLRESKSISGKVTTSPQSPVMAESLKRNYGVFSAAAIVVITTVFLSAYQQSKLRETAHQPIVDFTTSDLTFNSSQPVGSPLLAWLPSVKGAQRNVIAGFESDGSYLVVSWNQFYAQSGNSELINSQTEKAKPFRRDFKLLSSGESVVPVGSKEVTFDRFILEREGRPIHVMSVYRVGESYTASPFYGKLLEAYYAIVGGRPDGARILFAEIFPERTSYSEVPLRSSLEQFVSQMLPQLDLGSNRVEPD
ncbi:MAG: exosortase A, partial [bacterium]